MCIYVLNVILVVSMWNANRAGSSTCIPCAAGTYSSILGGLSCTACPAGRQCLFGATQPGAAASAEVDLTALAATRPSIKQSPMEAELANQANANTTLRALVLGGGGALVVLFLAFAIASQKVDAVGRLVNCSSDVGEVSNSETDAGTKAASTAIAPVSKTPTPSDATIWVKLDVVFSSLHFVPPGGVKEVRQTAFGGMMTLVFLVAILALSAQLAVDNLTMVYTTSIVATLPAWDPRGTYRVTARAHGIGLEACNGNVLTLQAFDPTEWTASGGVISSAWSATGSSSSLVGGEADGSCTVVWTCKDCTLIKSSASTSTVILSAPSRAWATYVEYTIEMPQLTSSATSGEASSLPVFAVQVGKFESKTNSQYPFIA
jgi:hypothetical protein